MASNDRIELTKLQVLYMLNVVTDSGLEILQVEDTNWQGTVRVVCGSHDALVGADATIFPLKNKE